MIDTHKISRLSLLLSLSLVLSYIESLIPFFSFLPGLRLGLGNIVVLYVLYSERYRDAFFISILRVLLSSLLFGTLVSFIYSLSGSLLSLLLMISFKKMKIFSPLGVSIVGGVGHNVGQILASAVMLSTSILTFLPLLILFGSLSGAVIGVITKSLLKRISYDKG